jgi:hypothetical protein
MEVSETILARGHSNILATHGTTFEITKESELSKRGDCIIAVAADKALTDLSLKFKESVHRENAKITVSIEAGNTTETINAFGDPQLILTHPTDIVVRKSNYICNRTLAIKADKSAADFQRKLVEKLRIPEQEVKIVFTVET